jgi:hypothetical protein
MTSKEFVLWLKGFTEGVHEFNITPKQWDLLKDKLAEVKDDSTLSSFPFGVPNTAPFVTLPHITPGPSINPNKPYEVYCGDTSGTISTPGMVVTTTPGHGSLTFNPSTSTTQWNPSGSNWSYTNNTYNPPYTTGGPDEVVKTHNED